MNDESSEQKAVVELLLHDGFLLVAVLELKFVNALVWLFFFPGVYVGYYC
jgi:hypothetical protein